jgi:penicillin-binding protein 1A
MAHAYDTLAENGQLTSGTMAADQGQPVGILKVTNRSGNLVAPEDSNASGLDKTVQQQVVPTSVAQETKSILQTVVESGTGTHAQTGGYVWGKTGTTTDNGDAWFVGATKDITVAVWVGYPNSNKAMSTLYNGGPVDGGTFPADIFHDVVEAWDQIRSDENHHHGGKSGVPLTTPSSTPSTAPSVTVAPATPTPVTPAPPTRGGTAQPAPATPAPQPTPTPTPAPGGGTSGGAPVTGGGGVTPP